MDDDLEKADLLSLPIIQQSNLPHGVLLIECAWQKQPSDPEPILPGRFVVIDNAFPVFLYDAKPGSISFLIPATLTSKIIDRTALTIASAEGSYLLGEPFEPPEADESILMLLDDNSLGAGIFFLKKYARQFSGVVLIGTENGFPFHPCPSRKLTPKMPNDLIAANPLLEDWEILNRLANTQAQPGCFEGTVLDLAQLWMTKHPVPWDVMDLTMQFEG